MVKNNTTSGVSDEKEGRETVGGKEGGKAWTSQLGNMGIKRRGVKRRRKWKRGEGERRRGGVGEAYTGILLSIVELIRRTPRQASFRSGTCSTQYI
jgi:hypothetical protein